MNTKKKSIKTVLAVSTFLTLYTFSRQTFIPLLQGIKLPGFDGPGFFGGANIAALFALIYASLQIPYGVLIDRYGLKKSITVLSLLMLSGFFISMISSNIVIFGIGRLITALGCAGAFISGVKVVSMEYDSEKMAGIVSVIVSVALILSLLFTKFIVPFIDNGSLNWRMLYTVKFVLAVLVFLYFIFGIKEKKPVAGEVKAEEVSFMKFLSIVRNNSTVLLLMLFAFIFFMIFYGINETIYIGDLLEKLDITRNNTYSVLLGGFLLGFLTVPFIANFVGELFVCVFFCLSLIIGSIVMYIAPTKILAYTLCFLAGYSNGLQMVVVQMASKFLPKETMGKLGGLFNVLFVGGVALAQRLLSIFTKQFSNEFLYLFSFICGIISLILILITNSSMKKRQNAVIQ